MKSLIFSLLLAYAQAEVDPNNITYYLSAEGIKQLENTFNSRISTDLSKVRFYLWTPEHGSENHWIFKAGVDPKELLDHGFDPNRSSSH